MKSPQEKRIRGESLLRHGKEIKDDECARGVIPTRPHHSRSHTTDARQRSQQKHISVIMNEATMSMSGRVRVRARRDETRKNESRARKLRELRDCDTSATDLCV